MLRAASQAPADLDVRRRYTACRRLRHNADPRVRPVGEYGGKARRPSKAIPARNTGTLCAGRNAPALKLNVMGIERTHKGADAAALG